MAVRRFAVFLLPVLAVAAVVRAASGQSSPGFRMDILVDGRPVCQYASGTTRYVEAQKGREYAIRLYNPLPVRAAVALSVDGLNTIDARRTTAREARKWVLDPHETVTISGWQTSQHQARRFFFTTEERSYARRLGEGENLGIISAVFFRERAARVIPLGIGAGNESKREGPQAPAPASEGRAAAQKMGDEYAATGIGERAEHRVTYVHLDLEETPAASLDIRYEFRAQLARLGILPRPDGADALSRRQRARGFADGGFCPDIR